LSRKPDDTRRAEQTRLKCKSVSLRLSRKNVPGIQIPCPRIRSLAFCFDEQLAYVSIPS
jgi:hypothetical protein